MSPHRRPGRLPGRVPAVGAHRRRRQFVASYDAVGRARCAVVVGGSAVKAAAAALIAQVVSVAAARAGVDLGALEYRNGAVHRREHPQAPSVLDLAALASEGTAEAAAASKRP